VDNQPSKMIVTKIQPVSSSLSLNQIISLLDSKLSAGLPNLIPSSSASISTIGYHFNGYDYQVVLPTTHALSFTISSVNTEAANYDHLMQGIPIISASLLRHGFGKPQIATSNDALLSSTYFYSSSQDTCEVNIYTSLEIECTLTTTLKASAVSADQFVLLYLGQAPNAQSLLVDTPVITTSRSPNYQLANMNIYDGSGETKVNYYKAGDNAWQIINLGWYNDPHEDGDITPNCADFESVAAIRAAYYGVPCYNSSTNSESVIN
jgi:hypothetical protein